MTETGNERLGFQTRSISHTYVYALTDDCDKDYNLR